MPMFLSFVGSEHGVCFNTAAGDNIASQTVGAVKFENSNKRVGGRVVPLLDVCEYISSEIHYGGCVLAGKRPRTFLGIS